MKKLIFNGINKKICFLVSIMIITSIVGISTLNFFIAKNELARSNNIILKNAIESIMVEINRNYSYTIGSNQWMTDEDAKTASLAAIGDLITGDVVSSATTVETDTNSSATVNSKYAIHNIDLGKSGYFFIVDSKGNIVSHPFLKDNIYELQSRDGRYIVQELINLAKAGGGTLNYTLREGVSSVDDSKTIYSQYFPHWDWIVTAVIYDTELARGSDIIRLYNTIGVLIVLAVSLFLTIWMTGKITKPIKKISNALYELSTGDLTVEKIHLTTNDETKLLGDSLNRLIDEFSDIVKMLMSSSNNLSTYTNEINKSSEVVSQATSEVAKAISQMAEQSDEQFHDTVDGVKMLTLLGENINETAEAGAKIDTVVKINLDLKEQGLASVYELKDATKENTENSAIIVSLINKINTYANDISDINTIITNVAKQTNILALNASIEASRAGERGQGFAVVAEEIRKLANLTAESTGNIRSQIEQMQSQTEEAVSFVDKINLGVEKINKTVNMTEDIISKISQGLQTLIEDIKVIIDHNQVINYKKDDILEILNHVSDAARDNSATIEEISATADEQSITIVKITQNISKLNDMVNDLNNLVNKFKV